MKQANNCQTNWSVTAYTNVDFDAPISMILLGTSYNNVFIKVLENKSQINCFYTLHNHVPIMLLKQTWGNNFLICFINQFFCQLSRVWNGFVILLSVSQPVWQEGLFFILMSFSDRFKVLNDASHIQQLKGKNHAKAMETEVVPTASWFPPVCLT